MDKHEWLMYMLKAMNKVTDDDIDVIMQQFDALDCDGSGYLDMDDLKNASNLRERLTTAPEASFQAPKNQNSKTA